MSIRHVVVTLLALLVLAVTWRVAQSDWARRLGQPDAKPAAPIVFDNGTVRQYDSPASVAARSKGQPMPLGTLRKCQRGTEVSYTNSFCPAGTRELKLEKGTVNVVESTAPAAVKGSPASGGPSLRERAVERAVQP
jgi:hypothetical protein